ncbi:MAG: arsenic efflux protein [Clostridia bacterium]|nr:arsenic efflux protein [Clostridia bacterium]
MWNFLSTTGSEIWEVLLDAFLDTLKLFPFLFALYILMEVFERFAKTKPKALKGALAPVIGSATGLIPQCGFSVMAAKLYENKYIRTGTLLAVFLATSDEALVILVSGGKFLTALALVGCKFLLAVAVGYLVNFVLRNVEDETGIKEEGECHYCGHEHAEHPVQDYFVSPLLHTLKICAYLFAVNLLFGFLFFFIGEDKVVAFLSAGVWVQPLITALVGLIPNCVSSVALTQAYLLGSIAFGSLVGGLCANAGLGLVVLLKNTKKIKRNLLFISTLFVISIAIGMVINLIEMLIAG